MENLLLHLTSTCTGISKNVYEIMDQFLDFGFLQLKCLTLHNSVNNRNEVLLLITNLNRVIQINQKHKCKQIAITINIIILMTYFRFEFHFNNEIRFKKKYVYIKYNFESNNRNNKNKEFNTK